MKSYIALLSILIMVVSGIGCSGGHGPTMPTNSDDLITPERTPDSQRVIWGVWELGIDTDGRSITVQPVRNVEVHFDVTGMITPPQCNDCLSFEIAGYNPDGWVYDVNVTAKNPTKLAAYDVRGTLLIGNPSDMRELVNADGYTTIFDDSLPPDKNPFRVFATDQPNRKFAALAGHKRLFRVSIPPPKNFHVLFVIDVSFPGNQKEPYLIYNKAINGYIDDQGVGTATVTVHVSDWQDDVESVKLDVTSLGAPAPLDMFLYAEDEWRVEFANEWSAVQGDYELWIEAKSLDNPNILYDKMVLTVGPVQNTPPVWDDTIGIVDIVPLNHRLRVYFGSASDPDQPVTYVIYYSEDSPIDFDAVSTVETDIVQPTSIFGLTNGIEYFVAVRARDATGLEDGNTIEMSGIPNPPPSIKVLSPNGGEKWAVGTPHNITWSSVSVSGTLLLEYSKDNFASDINIISADELNDGVLEWIIPNDISETVRVRITSNENPELTDKSDNNFAIRQPFIEVVNPNGGEKWVAGIEHDITWSSDGVDGTVFIEYSKDDFVSDINTIANDEENDGVLPWETPVDISDTVRVRVGLTDDPGFYDDSDDYFSISLPFIEVTVPNGGEQWASGSTHSILWEYEGVTSVVSIEYSTDNFVSEIYTLATDQGLDGSWDWENISYNPSSTMRVRITSTDTPSVWDISDDDNIMLEGWGRTWGGGISQSVAMDSSGNGYGAGNYNGIIDFDPSPGVDEHISNGQEDAYLVKFNRQGELQWANTWGSSYSENASGVTADDYGNIYVCGSYEGTVDFDPGPDTEEHTTVGYRDCFLSKFDIDGNFVWVKTWGGPSNDRANKVAVDVTGNPCVIGSFFQTADFNPGTGVDEHTSAGDGDVFVSKFDSSGNLIWAKTFGGTAWDDAAGIEIDSSHNIYIVGQFMGTADFDPGPDTAEYIPAGSADAYVCTLDTDGEFRWAHAWGAEVNDGALGVAVDSSGNAYITGHYKLTIDFDPGPGVDEHTPDGDIGIYLNSFDTNGNFRWAETWGGGNGYAIDANDTDTIFVLGTFSGTVDFDPDAGVDEHESNGSTDIFLSIFSSGGEFISASTWGGSSGYGDSATGISSLGSDMLYVTGYFSSSADLDPGPGNDRHTGGGAFISKFMTDGYW